MRRFLFSSQMCCLLFLSGWFADESNTEEASFPSALVCEVCVRMDDDSSAVNQICLQILKQEPEPRVVVTVLKGMKDQTTTLFVLLILKVLP